MRTKRWMHAAIAGGFLTLASAMALAQAASAPPAVQPTAAAPAEASPGKAAPPAGAYPASAPPPQGYYYPPPSPMPPPAYVLPGPQPMVHTVRKGLVVGGSITFGVSWGLAVVVSAAIADAQDCSDCGKVSKVLWIPVAGPVIADAVDNSSASQEHFFLGAWALTQAAGIAMFIVGIVGHDVPAYEAKAEPVRLHLVPTVGRNRTGLALAGNF